MSYFSSYLYYNPKGCCVAKLHKKLATIKDKLFRDLFRLLLCYHSWSHCFHYFVEKSFFTIFKKLSNFCLPSFRLSHLIEFLSQSISIIWLPTHKTLFFPKTKTFTKSNKITIKKNYFLSNILLKIQIMFYQIISIRGLNFCSSSSAENSPNFAHSLNKPKEQAVTRLL